MPTFVLTTSALNSYGYRVLTSGLDLEAFKKNPVMLWAHNRYTMPIGRWDNIRIEGDQLMADAVFDEQDELAQTVKSKVEQGILNATSIGFDVLEMSDVDVVPGQRRATVTKARIFEASIVDIPGNPDAVKLRFPEAGVTLSGNFERSLSAFIPNLRDMKNIALRLGLAEGADENQILQAVEKLQQQAASSDLVIKLGKAKGVITAQNEAEYAKLAAADISATLALIEKAEVPAAEKVTDLIRGAALGAKAPEAGVARDAWTIRDWEKKDPAGLLVMKHNEAERYQKLFNDFYN